MTGTHTKRTRRAFFLQGAAALGTGVATSAAAPASGKPLPPQARVEQLQQELERAAAREAIRDLQRSFTALMEQRSYEAAADLFAEQAHVSLSGVSASGRQAILQLFADRYRHQKAPVMHTAYRQRVAQHGDTVTLSEDGLAASAEFHVEAELCTPLQEDCTAAQMARLQGQMAHRRWESGRFEAQFVKTRERWRIASLSYFCGRDGRGAADFPVRRY